MDFLQIIRPYANQPLPHQLLMSLLKDYKRPNDKIHELLSAGILESVKKGMYITSPSITDTKTEPFLLANHLFGPSYISLDSALSYYGLIPERVYEVSSVTTKASRHFNTPIGFFSFTHLPLPYYSFGIRQTELSYNQSILIASPEKALFDKVITTSGITLRSISAASDYLLNNLRMDESNLVEFDTSLMQSWLTDAPKKESLAMIIKMITSL